MTDPASPKSAPETTECPICGRFMEDTGRTRFDEGLQLEMRLLVCPHCGVEVPVAFGRNSRKIPGKYKD